MKDYSGTDEALMNWETVEQYIFEILMWDESPHIYDARLFPDLEPELSTCLAWQNFLDNVVIPSEWIQIRKYKKDHRLGLEVKGLDENEQEIGWPEYLDFDQYLFWYRTCFAMKEGEQQC